MYSSVNNYNTLYFLSFLIYFLRMDTTIPGNPTDALSPSANVRCRFWSFQLHIGCKHIGFILSYISSYQNYTQTQTDIDHITLSVMSSTSRHIFFIIVSFSLMRDSITDITEAIRVAHSLPQIPVDSSMIWLVYPSETFQVESVCSWYPLMCVHFDTIQTENQSL